MATMGGARRKFEMTTFLEERSRPVTEVQNVVATYSVRRRNQTTLLPVSRAALNHSASAREQDLAKPKESKEKPSPSRKSLRARACVCVCVPLCLLVSVSARLLYKNLSH